MRDGGRDLRADLTGIGFAAAGLVAWLFLDACSELIQLAIAVENNTRRSAVAAEERLAGDKIADSGAQTSQT